MKKKFNFKYPKITALIITIVLAYIVFKNPAVGKFITNINGFGRIGFFIAGMLYTFGFTSPFSTGFFLTLNPENILLTGIIGGAGAMISDLFIFRFIRFSFRDEFEKLRNEKISRKLKDLVKKSIGKKTRKILMYIFACILIASPLPDEAGVIILAGLTKMKAGILAIIGFILNTLGILAILWIGSLI